MEKNGVSLGMDFNRKSVFSILKSTCSGADEQEQEKKLTYAAPLRVIYTDVNAYNKDGMPQKFFHAGESKKHDFSTLTEYIETEPMSRENFSNLLIPYIKHGAFIEEKESRLLFEFYNYVKDERQYVNYDDSDGVQKPYINVKYGNTSEAEQECSHIDIAGISNDTKKLQDKIATSFPQLKVNRITNKRTTEIYISAGINQLSVFDDVERIVLNHDESAGEGYNPIKIWCDGHWPIRSITIGPNPNSKIIEESIKHFCMQHHWLKYVTVTTTNTPYRGKP